MVLSTPMGWGEELLVEWTDQVQGTGSWVLIHPHPGWVHIGFNSLFSIYFLKQLVQNDGVNGLDPLDRRVRRRRAP